MNPSQLSPDDPRLTAYALGELEGEELAAVESALRLQPALRATVDEVREAAGQFESALLAEIQLDPIAEAEMPAAMATSPRPLAATVPGSDFQAQDTASYGKRQAKVLSFPRLYYIVGGMAAACFAIYAAFWSPEPQGPSPWNAGSGVGINTGTPATAPTVATATGQPQPQSQSQSQPPLVALDVAPPAAERVDPIAPGDPATPTPTTPFVTPELTSPAIAVAPTPALTPATSPTPQIETAPSAPVTSPVEATLPAPTPLPAPTLVASDTPPAPVPTPDPVVDTVALATAEPAAVLVRAVFNGGAPSIATRTDLISPAREAPAEAAYDPDALVPFKSLATAVAPGEPSGRALLLTNPIPAPTSDDIVVLAPMLVSGQRDYANARFVRRSARTRGLSEPRYLPQAPAGALFSRRADTYVHTPDNEFVLTRLNTLSSFSVESDTASYGHVRRALEQGQLPAREAVRIEELVNYFPYAYAPPRDDAPFAAALEVTEAPWAPEHRLVRIALKGREIPTAQRPALNLVFLVDVSASMNQANRLPLVKESMRMLVGTLRADDRVAIVTYGSASGLVLPSTPVARAEQIFTTLDSLSTAGTTNGGLGIQVAYATAQANAVAGGINRIVLCTDGDFNVGTTDEESLVRLIEERARAGIHFTAFGFGMGEQREVTLERLADKGHGLFGYIDSRREAETLLVERVNGSLVTIAKDVSVHVDFNPAKVSSYRLIGYENPLLRREDFSPDKSGAGEIGAGHTVTALYEVVPVGAEKPADRDPAGDQFRYQHVSGVSSRPASVGRVEPFGNELLKVSVDYKRPNALLASTLTFPLTDAGLKFASAPADFRFAAAVAQFGMILRDSPHRGSGTLGNVLAWATAAAPAASDIGGHRAEFIDLVRKAQVLVR